MEGVTMSLSENIKNAFNVVLNTYKNVDKLIKYCDLIAKDCGYEIATDRFLRYKSDSNYEGWLINGFVKLYQHKDDELLENEWKDGPIFLMEINFGDIPTVYLSRFEYENIRAWSKGVSPASYWRFTNAIDCEDCGFTVNDIESMPGYFISKPESSIKEKYWDVESVIYTNIDLLEIDSDNVKEKIFKEFDTLRDI